MSALGTKRSYSSRFQDGNNESFDFSVYPQSKRQKHLQGNPDVPAGTPNNVVFDRALWDPQFCNFGWDRLGALLSSNGNEAGPSTTIAPTSTSLDQTLSLPAESYTSLCTDQNGYSKTTDDIDEILRSSNSFGLSAQDMTSFPVQKHIEQITNDLNLQGNERSARIPRQEDQPWAPLLPNSQPAQCFQSNNRMSSTRANSVKAGLTNGLTVRSQLGKARSEIGPSDSAYPSCDFLNQSPEIGPTCSLPFNFNIRPTSNDRFGPGLFTDSSMLVNDGIDKQPPSTMYDDWGSSSNVETTIMPDLAAGLSSIDGPPQGPPWVCSMCDLEFKNQSESKKHWLRHLKPYKCHHDGCNRPDGFSTRNDLDRHRKSLHKIATRHKTDKTYRCAAPNCNKKTKIWPRLDNFRQHCARTHRDLPTDDLVKQSEYPKPEQRRWCLSRPQRNNEDSPTPALFHAPSDTSSLVSPVNTNNVPSSHRTIEGHSNGTYNSYDEKSSVSATPPAALPLARYKPHASNSTAVGPKDLSNPFVPHDSDMLRSSGRVLHRSMLSDGDLLSDRARLGQYSMPISRPLSYNTACRSTHPLLVNPRLQGGHQYIGNHSFPDWDSYHRARDTSLEKFDTRCLKILRERSRPRLESPIVPIAPAKQSPANEILKDALPSIDLSTMASQEARKITHDVATSGLLSSQVLQIFQFKLQDSLQRSLGMLEDRCQVSLQRALASLNLQNRGEEVPTRENENGKIAIDEERHKCLDCNKVKKTHSDLKKHVLRHSRPYTCTDKNCQLAFGSKNDWKRHERTIHDDPSLRQAFWCALSFDSIKDMKNDDKVMTSLNIEATLDRSFDGMPDQPLTWEDGRCLEPDVLNTERCQFFAWKKDDFYEHLYTKHGVIKPVLSSSSSSPHLFQSIPVCDPPQLPSELPSHYTAAKKARKDIKIECHIGRNGTNGFWCGFCNRVITINRALRGAPAWDARYKHIDEDHFREVGRKYFEEATRAGGFEGGSGQGTTRETLRTNKEKQGEEQQPWLPRKKGDLWVVLGEGKTKGRIRYEEEKEERDKVEHDTEYEESEEEDDIHVHDETAAQTGLSEIAAQHGMEDEAAAAATNPTTMPGQDHPSNITHPSPQTRVPCSSPRPAQPDPLPPEPPTSTLSISSNHADDDDELDNNAITHPATTQPPPPAPPTNESILDEDYIANLGPTHLPSHTPIQQQQQQQQSQRRNTRSATSAAAKLRWWRCHICTDGLWDSKLYDQCGNGECFHHRCEICWGQARN